MQPTLEKVLDLRGTQFIAGLLETPGSGAFPEAIVESFEADAARPLTPPHSPSGGKVARRAGEGESSTEGFRLSLQVPEYLRVQIASVDYQGWYYGYDENGNVQRRVPLAGGESKR